MISQVPTMEMARSVFSNLIPLALCLAVSALFTWVACAYSIPKEMEFNAQRFAEFQYQLLQEK